MAEHQTITLNDIKRCPKSSLSPSHYRGDGSCRCDEGPARRARIAELREQRTAMNKEIRDEIQDLERGL